MTFEFTSIYQLNVTFAELFDGFSATIIEYYLEYFIVPDFQITLLLETGCTTKPNLHISRKNPEPPAW